MALCLTGHGLGDSHLVNPSLCLLVLSSFVIKFYSFVFYFFLCTIWLVCIPLQKVVFFFNTDPSYLLKKKKAALNLLGWEHAVVYNSWDNMRIDSEARSKKEEIVKDLRQMV